MLNFQPPQLYLKQILNEASPYLCVSLKIQTVSIRHQRVTAGAESQDSESYAFVIYETTKIIFNKYIRYNRMRKSSNRKYSVWTPYIKPR